MLLLSAAVVAVVLVLLVVVVVVLLVVVGLVLRTYVPSSWCSHTPHKKRGWSPHPTRHRRHRCWGVWLGS